MATEYISVFVWKCSTDAHPQRYQRTDLRGSELSFTILHRIPVSKSAGARSRIWELRLQMQYGCMKSDQTKL